MHQAPKLSNGSIRAKRHGDKEVLVCASVQKNKSRQQANELGSEVYVGLRKKRKKCKGALGKSGKQVTVG